MPNHINLNKLLEELPRRASEETDKLIALAGQTIKIESSPDGEEISLGTVPPGKKWTTHYVVYVEEEDL